jgi:hypothetical protein
VQACRDGRDAEALQEIQMVRNTLERIDQKHNEYAGE